MAANPPAPALPDVWVEATPDSEVLIEPPVKVIIHNDDITPMDFVVAVLRGVFFLSRPESEAVMLTAHYTGLALVAVLPLEEAKYRVGKAHGMARAAGYPLTFTLEPQ